MDCEKDKRRHPRQPLDGKLRIAWHDSNGASHDSVALIVDASESGFRILLPDRLELRSYVHIRVDRYKFKSMACVRFSVRSGMNYCTGLEFVGGVRFPCEIRYTIPTSNSSDLRVGV